MVNVLKGKNRAEVSSSFAGSTSVLIKILKKLGEGLEYIINNKNSVARSPQANYLD
jgi:hypothetical protein